MHSSIDKLSQIRKNKYDEMVLSKRSHIDPALLPPSPRASFFYGLRVYHQLKVWRDLRDIDFNPLDWGWELQDQSLVPIMTDEEAGPPDILKIIRCGCNEVCDKRCSCRKSGLQCTSTCKHAAHVESGLQCTSTCKHAAHVEGVGYSAHVNTLTCKHAAHVERVGYSAH